MTNPRPLVPPKLDELAYCPTCTYPLKDGACVYCRETKAKAIAATEAATADLTARLGGPLAYEKFRLETIRATPGNRRALEAVGVFDPAKDNLFFQGTAGAGKTHIATACARRFKGALVIKSTELLRQCQRAAKATPGGEGDYIAQLVARPVLVIDDLGVERLTAFGSACLYEVLDGRVLSARGGLIITSNLNLDGLAAKLGEDRVTSRIAGLCQVIAFDGEADHRLDFAKPENRS